MIFVNTRQESRSFIEYILLKDLLALPDVGRILLAAEGTLSLLKGKLILAVELRNKENKLEDPTHPVLDNLPLMTRVVLRQNQLRPQLLDDPVREIIVLEHVDLLAHLRLIKVPVKTSQTPPNLRRLAPHFCLQLCPLLRLHEVDNFLGGNLRIIDVKGVAHGIFANEVEDFDSLNVVLFVDEEVELLPLFRHDVESRALEHEVAKRLQDADVHSQTVPSANFPLATVQQIPEKRGEICFGVVDALKRQTHIHLLPHFAQTQRNVHTRSGIATLSQDLLGLQAGAVEIRLSVRLLDGRRGADGCLLHWIGQFRRFLKVQIRLKDQILDDWRGDDS